MNSRIHILSVASLAVCLQPAAAQRPAPRDRVLRAVDALGGETAARGVNNLVYEYVAVTYQLGQEETPLSPPRGAIQNGRVVFDFANSRRMQDQEVRPATATTLTARQRRITLRDASMLEAGGQQTAEAAGPLATMQATLRLTPHRLLLAALDRPDALTSIAPRVLRGDSLDGVRYASGADTVALYFDRMSGRLVATETLADDPVLGDRRTTTVYTRWTPSGAIAFPRQIDVTVNGRALSHTAVFSANTNETLSDSIFAIPDSILQRARRPAPATPPVVVTLVELSPGVWRAEGGSHHTLVVEQPRGLVLVEAPQNRVRMSAVFDTLTSRFPSKPVQAVVSTHHHWDHSGGLRETMARGIPIVAHVRNVSFVRSIGTASKTVAPDALTRARRLPYIRSVRDTLTIGTGNSRVLLYALPTAHAEGMLAAYVPSAGILFTSDVVSPGTAPLPALGSRELARLASARGISPRRYAGGHGRVVEWEEIRRAASP